MARGDQAVWGDILAHLRSHHVSMCRQWFDEIEPLGVDSGVLSLRVNHSVRRAYLERECQPTFAEAAQAVTGCLLSVRFLGPDDELPHHTRASSNGASRAAGAATAGSALVEPKPHPQPTPAAPQHAAPPPPSWAAAASARTNASQDRLRLSPDHSFDNFVVGPGNRLAHAAATAVADNPGNAYNPLFFHGGVGLGKTHLLQAICLRLLERNPATRIHYTSCEEFLSGFVEALRQGDMSSFHHAFRDADVLVIDDIHFLAKGESAQEEFFHTFNALHHQRKQLVLSSDAPPEQIPQLEERLISRFKWGLVVEIEPPNTDTRAAIVRQKARMRGVEMPDDVARFVAERISANIRELEGAVVRLQIQSQVEKKPIDLALAKSALGEAPTKARPVLSVMAIVQTVGDYYGVKVSDLQSRRKQKSIVQPRQLCMFLARKHTRHSLEEIGGYLGGRDHTTVMHALSTVDTRLKSEPSLSAELQAIELKLASLDATP
ncbi:MAG: chromosomal replication initiator protein DnaA [Phycisphaeraceae bacterium]|nr:chromosomal replication initiator protein DnaA [Phycisphaeraceae bacterium]